MPTQEQAIEVLKNRIADLQGKAKNIRADLAEANRRLRQAERLAQLEKADAFYKEFGHMEQKLRQVKEQQQHSQKSPQ